MRTTIHDQIVRIASVLDSQGKADAPIAVQANRATLRAVFKPEKRGGPLRYGRHELQLTPAPRRDPNTCEMFAPDGRPTQEARCG